MTRSVLISINTAWNIYHFRAALIRGLQQAGHTVTSAAPNDAYSDRLRVLVSQHYPLAMDNAGTSPLRDAALLLRYLRLLRKVRPAIMLTYTIKPNIYGALAARIVGIPVIANVSGLGTAFIREGWLTGFVTRLYRVAFRGAACVFFQNPEDRELFERLRIVTAGKARLLPGSGVDIVHFQPCPSPAAAPIAFVLIARLLWDKGIGEYVAAARIVKAQHPQVRFRLVGPRGVRNQSAIADEQLAQWVAEGVIEYLGETDDVRDIIAQHDCVVLPSYREGMPRVLLEAAAMGKPLIASDVPGCRHIVTHGSNGLLCNARDAQSLANTMLDFIALSNPERARMGSESRVAAVTRFDEKLVIAAYRAAIAEFKST